MQIEKTKDCPLVSIWCLAYNQEQYVRQCLDGFIMQKTNFQFEIVIHDDASTDNTAAIIKEYAVNYPKLIKPILEIENQYLKHDGSIRKIMHIACSGKYIAYCEADDYWIDPLKLQKQVDFLESHQEYGMCYTNFNIYRQKKHRMIYNIYDSFPKQFPKEYSLGNFISQLGFVCPPSWLYRKELSETFKVDIKSLDTSFLKFAHFLHKTNVYYMPDITTVYRMHDASVSHQKSYISIYNRRKSLLESQLYLIDKYDLGNLIKNRCIEAYYNINMPLFVIHRQWDDIDKAKCILENPTLYIKCYYAIGKNWLGRLVLIVMYSVNKFFKSIYRYFFSI